MNSFRWLAAFLCVMLTSCTTDNEIISELDSNDKQLTTEWLGSDNAEIETDSDEDYYIILNGKTYINNGESYSFINTDGVYTHEYTLLGLETEVIMSSTTIDDDFTLTILNSNNDESIKLSNFVNNDGNYLFDATIDNQLFTGISTNIPPLEVNNWGPAIRVIAGAIIGSLFGDDDDDADFADACGRAVAEACEGGNVRTVEVTISTGWFGSDKSCKGDCK